MGFRWSSPKLLPSRAEPSRAEPLARLGLALAGSVLMAAALLKLAGWNVSAFAQYGWWLSANVQIAAIAWELILGSALLLGVYRPVTWLLAMLTFALFAGVSSYLGFVGQATCGCFGAIQASPWTAFGVDIGLLILLGLFRPRFNTGELKTATVESGKWAIGLAVVLATMLGTGVILYGSPSAALAKLRGETLTLDRATIDFGHGQTGDVLNRQVTVTNHSEKPLRIIGGTADCSCITTTDLPVTIAPGESKSVTIENKVPHTDKAGITNRQAILMTDCPKRPKLTLTLSASVD